MKKKTRYASISEQDAQETFNLFAPFLKEEEKEHFKTLTDKAESSNSKLQDRKELYYAISRLLTRFNLPQYQKQHEHLEYLADSFNHSTAASTKEINDIMDYYARGRTDLANNEAMAKYIEKQFQMAIAIAKEQKQEFAEDYDTFKGSIDEKAKLLSDKNWRREYFTWQRRQQREIAAIKEDYNERRKFSKVAADMTPESFLGAYTIVPLFIPAIILYDVLQLLVTTLKVPSVLAANLSKAKEEIPAVAGLFEQIQQAVPIVEHSAAGLKEHETGIHFRTPDDFVEQFGQALGEMDEKIEYFEQAQNQILTKYRTQPEAAIQSAPKKSRFIMTRKATHLAKDRLTKEEIDSGICELPPEGHDRFMAKMQLGLNPNMAVDTQLFSI